MTVTAKRVVLTSFLVDLLDIVLSVMVVLLSGSVVMFSQVLEGVADLISSGILIFGLKRSTKASDWNHPFGHGRELYFWTLISSMLMLGVTSTLSFYFGWKRFLDPEPIKNIYLALLVLGLTVITNGYACILSLRRLLGKQPIGKTLDVFFKSSFIETKTAFVLDLMGTSASILGIMALFLYKLTGDRRFDGLGAMIIGVVLAIFAIALIMSLRELLVGRAVPREVREQIESAILKINEVNNVLSIKAIYIGSEQIQVNVDVNLKDNLTTNQVELVINRIEAMIKKQIPEVSYVQIEPQGLGPTSNLD